MTALAGHELASVLGGAGSNVDETNADGVDASVIRSNYAACLDDNRRRCLYRTRYWWGSNDRSAAGGCMLDTMVKQCGHPPT